MQLNRPLVCRPPRSHSLRCAGLVVAALATLAACGSDDAAVDTVPPAALDSQSSDGSEGDAATVAVDLNIVVSDPPIADLVRQVAGPAVSVESIVPLGADGHTYEPGPADARALADADIYIENGLDMNAVVTAFAIANYPAGVRHFELSDVIPRQELISTDTAEEIAAHGHAHDFNAHFWPDLRYATMYVERIAEILIQQHPEGAAGYRERADVVTAQLDEMDDAFVTALATIPRENRKLVVYHDSWSYYGRRYSIPVVGAIQPTDFSEPSAAELRSTIEEVREANVPAFFGSEVFPSDVLEVIEEESGATYVADLSDDRLPGEPGSPEHSFQGMMLQNTRIIVEALGGEASALDAIVLTGS
jgi:ABC-type Zn uptake system ZnuABC Zn-binding protein ZnuA